MSLRKDVESWIACEATDRIAEYATRGRKHQHLTDEMLVAQWRESFRLMAEDVRDWDRRAIEDDYKAEFVLRGREPPYELIKDDFDRYIAETDLALAQLKAEDPGYYQAIADGVESDLQRFRRTRDKSKN